MIRVLFVCLGNICRSPLAEALFLNEIKKSPQALVVKTDSCGTSNFHEGSLADLRTRKNASLHGIEITHLSRPFTTDDFELWDYIVVMDKSNYTNLLKLTDVETHKQKISLMRSWNDGEDLDVPDPWFGDEAGFETVYAILEANVIGLWNKIKYV